MLVGGLRMTPNTVTKPPNPPRSIRRLMSPFCKGDTCLGSCVLCTLGYDE
jgi:hypothetical protein